MNISNKVKNLCEEYIDLVTKINECEAFVSQDAIKTAANYYALGSRYRELYGTLVKLSSEGYVQMTQIEDLMKQYRNTYGYASN